MLNLLKNDIYNLYLKTGCKVIEDEFIRLLIASSSDFKKWLDENSKFLLTEIKDKNIINSLYLLDNLLKKYPAGISKEDVNKFLYDPKFGMLNKLPYLILFNKLLNKYSFLNNYASILNSIPQNISLQCVSIDQTSLESDLDKIDNYYRDNNQSSLPMDIKRLTKKEKTIQFKKDMYKQLISRFSRELSDEAKKEGKNELADAFGAYAIASPYKLSKFIPVTGRNDLLDKKCKEILKHIYLSLGDANIEKNYEHIRSSILSEVNLLDGNDYFHPSNKFTRTLDELNGTQSFDKSKSKIYDNSLFVNNIKALSMLNTFFYHFTVDISSLPEIPD